MNLFGFNITRSTPLPITKSLSPSALEWLRGEDVGSSGARLQNAYQQVVWVYRAINVLAEQVANIPFRFSVGEAGGEHLITSGPLLDFYARPHPHINRFQYWELRIIWLMLRGECFRVPIYESFSASASASSPSSPPSRITRHTSRKLQRVLILDPAHFHHIIENNELIGWRYTGFGTQAPLASQMFLPEEVWFEKLPNPFDFWRGMPPLYVAETAIKTDFAAGAFMQGLIENNADTGVIVRTDKQVGPDQQEQIIAALKDRKRKAGTADKPLLLNGVTEVLKPELSSSDLQFLENRKFSRAEICAAFGVPEEIVTTTDTAKYDVMAGARLNFIENRVIPLCRRLEAEEDVTVKSLDPGAAGWFDLDSLPILQAARQSRLTSAQTGFQMGVPFNELNRVLDLGFKPLPWGEKGWVAGGLQGAGEGSPESKVWSPKSGEGKRSEIIGQRVGDPFGKALEFLSKGVGEVSSTNIQHPEKLQQPSSKTVERALLAGKLRRFFFEQRSRVLARLRPTGLTGPTGQMAPALDELFELAGENEKLLARLQPLGAPWPVKEINESTLSTLKQTWQAGVSAGETIEQLTARVRRVYNEAARDRAEEIAARITAASQPR